MKPCPKCNGSEIWPEMGTRTPFGMVCYTCGFLGPRVSQENPDEAMAAWDSLPRLDNREPKGGAA